MCSRRGMYLSITRIIKSTKNPDKHPNRIVFINSDPILQEMGKEGKAQIKNKV